MLECLSGFVQKWFFAGMYGTVVREIWHIFCYLLSFQNMFLKGTEIQPASKTIPSKQPELAMNYVADIAFEVRRMPYFAHPFYVTQGILIQQKSIV